MTSTPVAVQTPKITPAMWVAGDAAATLKTVYAAATTGSKVVAVIAASTDTGTHVGQLFLTRASSSFLLGSANIVASAGNDGSTSTANLLAYIPGLPTDNDGQPYMFLQSGDLLQASQGVACSSGRLVYMTGIGADF